MKKIIYIMLILLFVPSVIGVSIGVSPGRIKFNNMLRDGYAELYVTISSSISEDVIAHYEIEGEISEWFAFDPPESTFTISSTQPYRLKIIATPPDDTAVGSYSSEITFITDALASVSGAMGSTVRAAVISKINVEITDKQIMACRAVGFNFQDVEVGDPLEFSAVVYNDGNVRLKPHFFFEIWDQKMESIVQTHEIVGAQVLPTTKEDFSLVIDKKLNTGQYWVNIIVRSDNIDEKDCFASDYLTFNVYERGTILDRGVLEKVSSKVWAFVGEIIPVTATFKNTGDRSVDAKFKGTISLDDEIVELLESEELRVEPGNSVDFETFFTPDIAGRFVVTGRVLYNNKLTFEKGTVVNVNEKTEEEGIKIIPIILYLAILSVILYLIYRIRKEGNKSWKKR